MGLFIDKKGYPRDKKIGVLIHRKNAADKVGGYIFPGMVVHHKDGNKRNFKKSNLKIMSRSNHSKLHARERYRR